MTVKILATFFICYSICNMYNKENKKLSKIIAMVVAGYFSKIADDDEKALELLAERRLITESTLH